MMMFLLHFWYSNPHLYDASLMQTMKLCSKRRFGIEDSVQICFFSNFRADKTCGTTCFYRTGILWTALFRPWRYSHHSIAIYRYPNLHIPRPFHRDIKVECIKIYQKSSSSLNLLNLMVGVSVGQGRSGKSRSEKWRSGKSAKHAI